MNDISIISGIVAFFLIFGFVTPFINAEFGTTTAAFSHENLEDELPTEADSNVTIWKVLTSVGSIFFWSISGLPNWLNVLLFIPRLLLLLIIARNVWVGGGG